MVDILFLFFHSAAVHSHRTSHRPRCAATTPHRIVCWHHPARSRVIVSLWRVLSLFLSDLSARLFASPLRPFAVHVNSSPRGLPSSVYSTQDTLLYHLSRLFFTPRTRYNGIPADIIIPPSDRISLFDQRLHRLCCPHPLQSVNKQTGGSISTK